MRKLARVLRGLKKEDLRVKTEEDILHSVKFLGETDVLNARENFNIIYNGNNKEFKLETSWSNQLVTDEWLKKITRLHKLINS